MMAEEDGNHDSGIHKIIPAKGDSPKKRREKIIVLSTIALVILTVILVARRGGGGSSGSDGTQNVDGFNGVPGGSGSDTGGANDGFAGGGGAIGDPTLNGIGSEIGALGAQESTDEGIIANLQKRVENLNHRVHHKGNQIGRLRAKTQAQSKRIKQERKDITTLKGEVKHLQHTPTHAGKKGQQHAAGHHAVAHPTVRQATHRSR